MSRFMGVFGGLKLYVDPSIPKGEIHLRNPNGSLLCRITGIKNEPTDDLMHLRDESVSRLDTIAISPSVSIALKEQLSLPDGALPYEEDGDYD